MSNFKELVRVGKDAVIRNTSGGKPVTSFLAAFDNGWGDRKQTVWLDCSWWGPRGEKLAEYLTKGSQVVIEGSIGTREHDGKTYITLDVSDVKLVGGREGGGNGTPRSNTPSSPRRQKATDSVDWDNQDPSDDIPFISSRGSW